MSKQKKVLERSNAPSPCLQLRRARVMHCSECWVMGFQPQRAQSLPGRGRPCGGLEALQATGTAQGGLGAAEPLLRAGHPAPKVLGLSVDPDRAGSGRRAVTRLRKKPQCSGNPHPDGTLTPDPQTQSCR